VATITHLFDAGDAALPATAFAAPDVAAGTNFPVPSLRFDAASDENAYFRFRAVSYGSGNLTVELDWYADTATSGDVIWGASVAAITPDTDSTDVETKAFGTVATVTDSHLGTTAQRVQRASITISSLDSIAAGDWCMLRVYRDGDAAGDTMAGDAQLVGVTLTYSDT
jgi:hypothetical protein